MHRYNPNKGELTLGSEQYPEREDNRLHIVDTLRGPALPIVHIFVPQSPLAMLQVSSAGLSHWVLVGRHAAAPAAEPHLRRLIAVCSWMAVPECVCPKLCMLIRSPLREMAVCVYMPSCAERAPDHTSPCLSTENGPITYVWFAPSRYGRRWSRRGSGSTPQRSLSRRRSRHLPDAAALPLHGAAQPSLLDNRRSVAGGSTAGHMEALGRAAMTPKWVLGCVGCGTGACSTFLPQGASGVPPG